MERTAHIEIHKNKAENYKQHVLNRDNDLHIQPSQLKVNGKMCFDRVPIFYLVQWSKHLRCGVFND